jgi:hypothetical protein
VVPKRQWTRPSTWFLRNAMKVDARDNFGRQPLHLSIEHPAMIDWLIEHGADVNALSLELCTPLHFLCDAKDECVASGIVICDHGALINAQESCAGPPF